MWNTNTTSNLFCANFVSKWTEYGEVGSALHELRTTFLQVRSYLRKMGELADVPLEPPPQTKLADATMDLKGVLFAGVPGGTQTTYLIPNLLV